MASLQYSVQHTKYLCITPDTCVLHQTLACYTYEEKIKPNLSELTDILIAATTG